MKPMVTQSTLDIFSKQLTARSAVRHKKSDKEKKYDDKITKANSKKFDEMKRQTLEASGYGVVDP